MMGNCPAVVGVPDSTPWVEKVSPLADKGGGGGDKFWVVSDQLRGGAPLLAVN